MFFKYYTLILIVMQFKKEQNTCIYVHKNYIEMVVTK